MINIYSKIPNAKNFTYLNGDIIIQPYAPQTSTETRLIVKKNAKNKIYHVKEYEGKLSLFNYVYRASYYSNISNVFCAKQLLIVI